MGGRVSTAVNDTSAYPSYNLPPPKKTFYSWTAQPAAPPPQEKNGYYYPRPPPATSSAWNAGQVTEFHSSPKWKAYFEASRSSNKLIVVDFTATWCGPCRMIEPKLIELAAKYVHVDFVKIDVDELMDIARQFKVNVMPTFLFIKRGKEVDRLMGAKKEELERKIENHMVLYNYRLPSPIKSQLTTLIH